MDRTGRNCVNLEQRLLQACREAVREGHWQVAEHLLRALEDLAKLDPSASGAVEEAYSSYLAEYGSGEGQSRQ